ncbi:hypothetical protein GGTG_08630 [Gaeumannomyces tritici R3-111a-1]|uniref:Uncharacterized protein n=1 Tax=Gaeumannomyces tritici (strain R3-111a-1) TaxID=644352 RepID=J3P544_GAET3|nr:hypothetical protein GGTG_08630 [Gaeumannomyces tritici R3-111a-1]EJT74792.1 hypothetical protein GGTG_08630 [Gaeumannomyces tritici R3-111a-1]
MGADGSHPLRLPLSAEGGSVGSLSWVASWVTNQPRRPWMPSDYATIWGDPGMFSRLAAAGGV